MRRLILQEFVSLDGLAAGPNDNVDFVPASTTGDPSMDREQNSLLDGLDAMLLGRKTYQLFFDFWPNVTEGDEKAFADRFNAMPKIVFSSTLDRAPWGKWPDAKIVRTSASQEVSKLKQQPGKDLIVWGSISLAQSLMKDHLIDEYRIVVCPVVLGSGRPLFDRNVAERSMKLQNATALDHGAVSLRYIPSEVLSAGRTA
jgi:dihydrofolate reductase